MKTKMNNKGFSLVELIVVIAIMAILAVTLAPRLSQYVEKSRKASDQEAVNTIFSAAKLANVEYPLGKNHEVVELGALSSGTASVFEVSTNGKTWTLEDTYTDADADHQDFWDAFIAALGNFELKSNEVKAPGDSDTEPVTQISLSTDADGMISVVLTYDGSTEAYKVSE